MCHLVVRNSVNHNLLVLHSAKCLCQVTNQDKFEAFNTSLWCLFQVLDRNRVFSIVIAYFRKHCVYVQIMLSCDSLADVQKCDLEIRLWRCNSTEVQFSATFPVACVVHQILDTGRQSGDRPWRVLCKQNNFCKPVSG